MDGRGISITPQGETLNIHLKGENSISALYRAITGTYQNTINFTGDPGATLTVTLTSQTAGNNDRGLWNALQAIWPSGGTVNMDGVNITTKGCRYGISADNVSIKNSQFTVDGLLCGIEVSGGGTLSIDNSTIDITVKMNDGAWTSYWTPQAISTQNISLRDCQITTTGITDTQGDNIGAYQSTILDDDGNIATELKIEPAAGITPPTRYDLYLGRTRVNSNNANGLTSANTSAITAGSASYDAATNTLTLDNATINGSGTIDGLRSSIVGMTIKLVGDNTISNTTGDADAHGQQFAVELAKWNTILSDDGTGTLTTNTPATTGSYGSVCAISDYDQSGAMYIKNCTVTIKGGEMGINTKGQPLKIQDATVTLQNTEADYYQPVYANPFNLIDCEIVTPASAYVTEWGDIRVSDESQSLHTVIIRPIDASKKTDSDDGNATCYTDTQTASITSDGSSTETNVQIPETLTADGGTYTVTAIADGAYQDNTSVQTVTIPATVDYVGENAFDGCTNLTDIIFEGATPPYTDRDSFDGTNLTTAAFPAAANMAYSDAYNNGWLPGTTYDIYQPTVMMRDNEWITIYSTQSYSLDPTQLEAYIVTGINYETAQVTIHQEQGIIARVPMLLRKLGTDRNYPVPPSMSIVQSGTPCGEFKGSEWSQEITSEMVGKAYILYQNKFVRSAAGTLPAYKCYLLTDGSFTAAAPAMTIVIDNGNGQTTPVSQLRAGQPATAAAPCYTLDGRRLSAQPTRPGLYIRNGQKLIIK